jgi:hypothetical protein
LLAVCSVLLLAFAGCKSSLSAPPPALLRATPQSSAPAQPTLETFADLSLGEVAGQCVGPDIGPPVVAALKPYTVDPSLSQVHNLRQFSPELDENLRGLLAKNLFAVQPTTLEQLFYLYDWNEENGLPSFVTLDGALHLWHVAFDYTLRYLERTTLLSALEKLTRGMLEASLAAHKQATSQTAREAASRLVAYFAVPARLLELRGLPTLPKDVAQRVDADLKQINSHQGISKSAVTGFDISFDLFVPRGHYTRRTEYKRFFRAMSWYGNAYWAFPDANDPRGTISAASAALMCKLLLGQAADPNLLDLWRRVYEATSWFVGSADDPTPEELWPFAKQVYGGEPSISDLANARKAADLCALAAQNLRPPLIRPSTTDLALIAVRFMGTRFIPDSYLHHNLVYDRVKENSRGQKRWLPRGLDVLAALGSSRALYHLTELYNDDAYAGFTEQMDAMRSWLRAQPPQRWVSNMYWGWMWVLAAIAEPKGQGYPSFMTTEAWTDKQLWTALASWAELRHDTILYAKEPMAEGEGPEAERPKGYVEPDVQAWRRLKALVALSRQGLIQRHLLDDTSPMAQPLAELEQTLTRLEAIAEKELAGQHLADEEYDFINYIGGTLGWLQLSFFQAAENKPAGYWWEIENDVERRMACVADVATGDRNALEVAVGPGYTIYVICPIEGKLTLTRGAIFSYFEFPWPASDRLTDEHWNQMITNYSAPEAPKWASSFLPALALPHRPWQKYFPEF